MPGTIPRFLFFCLLLVGANALAAGTLSIVTGNNYPPFSDENLPEGGLSSLIVKRVLEEVGYDVKLSFMPWKRGYESAKNGVHVATFPYVKRPDRELHFNYSLPINTITQLVFVRADSDIHMDKVEQLAGLTTCVPRGYAITESVSKLADDGVIKMLSAPDAAQCYLMLRFGRIDFVTFNQYVGWSAAESAAGDEARMIFRALETPLETEGLHLIFSKGLEDGEALLSRFDQALQKLRDNGFITRLESTYLDQIRD
jgi:polar amino acid transport system substrate-binding protein